MTIRPVNAFLLAILIGGCSGGQLANGNGDAAAAGTGQETGVGGTTSAGGTSDIGGATGAGGTSDIGGTTGAGGTSDIGGTTGAAGTGGIGGTTGAAGTGWIKLADAPSCLQDLFAMCPWEGACQQQAGGSICFASGTRVTETDLSGCNSAGGTGIRTVTEVRKADGSLCYTKTMMASCITGGEYGSNSWTNALGEEVATATFTYFSWTIRCAATGETKNDSCNGHGFCHEPDDQYLMCTAGSCP